MRKSAKRFLSTVLAMALLCSCMAVMNVSTVLADDSWVLANDSNFASYTYSSSTKSVSSGDLTYVGNNVADAIVSTGVDYPYLNINGSGSATGRRFEIANCSANDTITIAYTATASRTITIYENYSSSSDTATVSGDSLSVTGDSLGSATANYTYTVAENGTVLFYFDGKMGVYSIARASANTTTVDAAITVVDEDGNEISDFTVTSGSTTITPSSGVYTLTAGTTYTVSADGYASNTFTAVDGTTAYTVTLSDAVAVTGITVSPESAEIYVGRTTTLEAAVSPENATDSSVTWSSNNESVATVSSGTVTGVAAGTAVITVTTTDGGFAAEAEITVKAAPSISGTSGTTNNLVAATTTTTYTILQDALDAGFGADYYDANAYDGGYLYFDSEILSAGSSGNYFQKKTTTNLDGSTNSYGLRVRTNTDMFALKLAAGSTVTVPVRGGGSGRYAYLTDDTSKISATYSTETDYYLDSGDCGNTTAYLTYTNETGSDKVIYISATKDSYISQIKVTVPGDYYAYFGVTEEEQASYGSYYIAESADSTALAEGDTVYSGVSYEGDDDNQLSVEALIEKGIIDEDSAYVVAYLVTLSSGNDVSDLGIYFE